MTEQIKQVCLIGCGASGIPAVKALVDRGISFDCFEAGDDIGGNWLINNSNGMSAAYESLRINTSRELMEYADFPMSDQYPVYPDHHQIKDYFDAYFDHFTLRDKVTFNSLVVDCQQQERGLWKVRLENGNEYLYQHLIVANGHHWDPRWPEPPIPGEFSGLVMHSHSYISPYDPVDLTGKQVVILGMGNSAMDIACELSQPSLDNTVYLSVRNSAWVLPRYIFGQPTGQKIKFFPHWRVMSALTKLLLRLSHGTPMAHGLPRPNHEPMQAHPTISQSIYDKLDTGEVLSKPNIAALHGSRVKFVDGSEVNADVVIYATGYKVSFPFFDPGFLAAEHNELPLWQHLVPPYIDNLFFLGLFQPLGAIMPLAEKQAKLVADVLVGSVKLPAVGKMLQDMERERITMRNRYVESPRHTMQVDGPTYDKQLDRIRRDGEAAARQPAPVLNPLGLQQNARRHNRSTDSITRGSRSTDNSATHKNTEALPSEVV